METTTRWIERRAKGLVALVDDEANRLVAWPDSADDLAELSVIAQRAADELAELACRIVGQAEHCRARDAEPVVLRPSVARWVHREEIAAEVARGEHD